MDKKASFNFWYLLIAIGAMLLLQYFWLGQQTVDKLTYSEFLAELDAGNVAELTVSESRIRGKYRIESDEEVEFFETYRVDSDIAERLEAHDVRFGGTTDKTILGSVLSWVLPALIFVGIWFFLFRRITAKGGLGGLGGGYMEVGKSKARVYMERQVDVTFDDVAGVDEAKEELQEIIEFLRRPESYSRLGARLPKGVLLVGPPGTGKTLLARAVAGEAAVPFFSISGSEFVEMFVGVGASRVRDLFEQARKQAPCIIFIDELDAVGRARGIGPMSGGHDEKEQTLNQLLAELDGFDSSSGIVLLGATNRPEILDSALLRAGRFDRQILVDRPDKLGREQILNVHLRKVRLAPDVEAEKIAALTTGFTGADLANLVNEAALLGTRRKAKSVTMDDVTRAIERIIAGLEKRSRLLGPLERKVVAYHEMGHALSALHTPGSDVVHKVSIIPRGIGALGYTIQRPTEDRFLMTRTELENKMTVLLGGRAAEHLVFDELSTGAQDDLARATDIARNMVTRFGMDETLGQMSYESEPSPFLGQIPGMVRQRDFSEETAREIDCAVRDLVAAAFERAATLLAAHRAQLDAGAAALLKQETLSQAELSEIVAKPA
ncbi:MAG: ATP-dependent zinc metalloprotease FtsH [Rhodospirillaceae bacterium]|nr:ATP-dependent zinc metalloprotease FtsH [Rhodospirillaceae bacterium]MBT3925717.1 ATP-dependent zinc metalloprotease FtsH [Rhodospirillaceae bacterium]MBT5781316.1 ATP-dependent zinc metalloprotease FtsH [Rhodospirillaceae bacterium]MBT7293784.1 ATP-dependent zinc metalloprotease FtsH [Rhodospirillaceae bacterium]